MTPLLGQGGESNDLLTLNFLLLREEEYPDHLVGGRWCNIYNKKFYYL
jgi:hypothetical protein